MTDIPAESEPVSFDTHVRPLFRPHDRESMQSHFDLWSYDDVTANASAIVTQLRARHNALRRRLAGGTSRPHSAMGGHGKGTLTGTQSSCLLSAGALAVPAPWPAAGPTLAFAPAPPESCECGVLGSSLAWHPRPSR